MKRISFSLPAAAALLLAGAAAALAGSTIDPARPYAYGQNIGWVNARPDGTNGAVIGQFYCAGRLWSANCGWITLGSGAPANGWSYANDSAADWGVNHDGEGRLAGLAYGANIGWIAFEQVRGFPRVDLRTGNLHGHAWGANVGWISLSNAQAFVRTASFDPGPDADLDQLPDPYEFKYAGSLTNLSGLAGRDTDGDGSTDLREARADTDPLDPLDSLRIVAFEAAGGGRRLAWTARPTRLYRVEATNAVGAGGWADAGPGLLGPPAASPLERILTDAAGPARFYRVKAVVPLSE